MFGRETKKLLQGTLQSLDDALKLADDANAQLGEAAAMLDKANRVAEDWERMYREATQSKPDPVYPPLEFLTSPGCRWIN